MYGNSVPRIEMCQELEAICKREDASQAIARIVRAVTEVEATGDSDHVVVPEPLAG